MSDGMRIALFGATGAAGTGALRACLAAPDVAEVVAVGRRAIGLTDPRLTELRHQDFTDLAPLGDQLAGIDACLYCLGVSQSQVPEEARYREITHDYAVEAARVLKERSPGHVFHFLSGQGTNPSGRFMWARIKGQTENDLRGMDLAGIVCWRPGYIHPAQARDDRPWTETLIRGIYPLLRPLKGMSVGAEELGRAMLEGQRQGRRSGVVENAEIRELAAAALAR